MENQDSLRLESLLQSELGNEEAQILTQCSPALNLMPFLLLLYCAIFCISNNPF